MNRISIVSISLGFLILIIRGPLVLFPEPTVDFLRGFIRSVKKVRITGVVFFVYGLFIILMTQGINTPAADFFRILGYFFALVPLLFLIIFPAAYSFMADAILSALDPLIARILGLIGLIIALIFFYYGFFVL